MKDAGGALLSVAARGLWAAGSTLCASHSRLWCRCCTRRGCPAVSDLLHSIFKRVLPSDLPPWTAVYTLPVLVEQNVEMALDLADRAVVLDQDEVVYRAAVAELLAGAEVRAR